jgi:hypothetical protein
MSENKIEKQNEVPEAGLVDGPRLLEVIFPNEVCRPSMRWLKTQEKKRAIPFMRIGRLIFYDPPRVRAALTARTIGMNVRVRSMPGSAGRTLPC